MAVMAEFGAARQCRLLGLGGSVVIALASLGSGVLPQPNPWLHTPVLGALQTRAGSNVCIAMAALGMLALVVAWLRLGRLVDHSSVRAMTVTATWWAVPFALAPPVFSRDVYAYAAAGDLVQHGMNPYEHGPADLPSRYLSSTSISWYHVPFAYGPLFLVLTGLVATLAVGHLVLVVAMMRIVALIGVAALAWGLPRLAERCGADPRRALWLGLANPLVLAHFVGGAHADALMAGLIVAGLALATRRQPLAGTAVLALAVAVKATAGLALPFVALLWAGQLTGSQVRRTIGGIWRSVLVFAVVFGGVSLASGLGFGWVGSVSTIGKTEQWTSVSTGLGLALGNALSGLGVTGAHVTALTILRDVGLLAFAILAVVLWLRAARADDIATAVRCAGWTLLGFVLLGPVVHPWYLLWGLTVLAAAVTREWALAVLAWGSALLCFLVLPNGYNLARATMGIGEVIDVLVVVAIAVWAGVRLRRRVTDSDHGSPARQRIGV